MVKTAFYRILYRPLMCLAHRYSWHYAPVSYIEKDEMRWCQWCGLRSVTRRAQQNVITLERPVDKPAPVGHSIER